MNPPILLLAAAVCPSDRDIPALCEALQVAFPGEHNADYLSALIGNGRLPALAAARLGALALLPPLAREAGMDTSRLRLGRDRWSRPFVNDDAGTVPFDFNLSHSASHVACALLLGGGWVGVDVEEPIPPSRSEALLCRFGTDGERAMLSDTVDFTVIWTMREALGKQAGRGEPLFYDASRPGEDVSLLTGRLPDTGAAITVCLPRTAGVVSCTATGDFAVALAPL